MKLEYTDYINHRKVIQIDSTITDGEILLEDGTKVGLQRWILYSYRVIQATKKEKELLELWKITPRYN